MVERDQLRNVSQSPTVTLLLVRFLHFREVFVLLLMSLHSLIAVI